MNSCLDRSVFGSSWSHRGFQDKADLLEEIDEVPSQSCLFVARFAVLRM